MSRYCAIIGLVLVELLSGAAGHRACAGETLRVMSFNLRYASSVEDQGSWKQWDSPDYVPQRRQCVVQVITNRQPDLAGLQEGEDAQLDYLVAHLPGSYALQRQRPSGGSGTENAAMLWNTNSLELVDSGVFSLGTSPGGGYWNNAPGTDFNPYLFFSNMGLSCPRLALWGLFRLRSTGQSIHFYTTHFDFNTDPQVASASLIADDALTRCRRLPLSPLSIVVGDFNSTQDSSDWKLFTGGYTNNGITGDFTDSWWQVKGAWNNAGTMHGYAGGQQPASSRIDWILHRGGLTATQMSIITDSVSATNLGTSAVVTMYPSDHYPVLATLTLPPVASDADRDGLPDAVELATAALSPSDPDTDHDGLLDGAEDINGNGMVDGGETDPSWSGDTQNPTDIRSFQMDGILDARASRLASHGMDLDWRFDGRYLYVATQDAGEGSDHFIFVCTSATDQVAAPWAKSGLVSRWCAYLTDENDSGYVSWYDAAGSRLTNTMAARAATYYQNGGRLEGVIDLSAILGVGFTSVFYLAAAPFGTADSGILYPAAQVPAGNGDGNILGTNEYVRIEPGDRDHDGISDYADPDRDGDGLPDAWETAYGLSPDSTGGVNGAAGDWDGDGQDNASELAACTSPANSGDCFRIQAFSVSPTNAVLEWPLACRKAYALWTCANASNTAMVNWSCLRTNPAGDSFPAGTGRLTWPTVSSNGPSFFRLTILR